MIRPHILIISLERAKDRKEAMEQQLKNKNIENVHWYPAFDGKNLTNPSFSLKIEQPEGYYCYRRGEPLLPNAVGCTLSHIGCISMAQALDWEYVIILEDDVILCEDWNKRIDYLFQILPPDWEHVYLSGAPHNQPELDSIFLLLNYMNVMPSRWMSCTYGYVLRNTAYTKVIKVLSSLGTGVDDLYGHIHFEKKELKSYTFYPFVLQANLDIGSQSDFGNAKMQQHPSTKYFKNKMN